MEILNLKSASHLFMYQEIGAAWANAIMDNQMYCLFKSTKILVSSAPITLRMQ